MILNKAPIRTSNNYGINNIDLKFDIPQNIENFESLTICGDSQNFKISNEVDLYKLKYGISNELEELNFKKGNKNLKIEPKKDGTITLEFNLNEDDINLLENIEIISKENSNSSIIIKYLSDENLECFHNGIIKVKAQKNSTTNIIIVNMLNYKANNILSFQNNLEENAKINYTIVDFGGEKSITNWYSSNEGENSEANINTIYLGIENQIFDINYISELFGKNTKTNIEVQGALKDTAKKNFKGTIDFKNGAKKAKGNENEFCMLLSEKAKSKALPMLLCSEEDVEGNHSTAAGRPKKDELFYIMSRGFSYKDALKLIVRARFNNILKTIKCQKLREEILSEIDKRL